MPLILTPEQKRRVTAYAQERKKPVEAVLDERFSAMPIDLPEPEAAFASSHGETLTRGASKIIELRAAGVMGGFQNRPEDNPE